MKKLIQDDIIGSIDDNVRLGNITVDDSRKLKRLTHRLYEHIYAHYEEMEELNEMTDESLMLDIDIIEKEHERELAERDRLMKSALALKDEEIEEKKSALALKDKEIEAKESALALKDEEIASLKKQLEMLSKKK